jgi:hypothetical protein
MGGIQKTFVRSGFRNHTLCRSPLRIAHRLNLMQRDHTAEADIDELEILHDESNRALFWTTVSVGRNHTDRLAYIPDTLALALCRCSCHVG